MVRRDIAFYPHRDSELSYGQFNIISIYGNDRKGRMKFLKDALMKRQEKIDQWLKVIEPGQILFIDSEGLITNYDGYENYIEQFLGNISGRHKLRKRYFDPEVAKKKCIEIYKEYLNAEDLDDLSSLEEWYSNKIKLGIASKVL